MEQDDDRPADVELIVLGAEMATASAIEQFRLQQHPEASPLADLAYPRAAAFVESPAFRQEKLDTTLRSIVERWARIEPDELRALRSTLSMDDFSTLMTFARRSLVLGLRSGDETWPLTALDALTAVAYERVDFRDLTMAAALVAYALGALEADAGAAMERAATRSDPGTATILRRFRDRPPQSLASWGYAVVDEGRNISLVRSDLEPYAPTVDLLSSARGIAAAIDGDHRYQTESIAVAGRFWTIWLRGGTDEIAAGHAVEEARACVTVRAGPSLTTLGPDELPGHHMFVVFILELTTSESADLVARAATTGSGDHARLAVAGGPVAAILISRAVAVGIAGLETDASLQRFSGAFAAALS